jgi:hypothetical protein
MAPMLVITKAEILLRLQTLEQEARELAILVENADVIDDEPTGADALEEQKRQAS